MNQTHEHSRPLVGSGVLTHQHKLFVLFVLLFVGLLIATIDGLTRAPNDFEEDVVEEFEYVPYPGALAFAALSLPLIFSYAKRRQIAKSEALLLWLLLCTAAYQKDFAYIKIPHVPVYVTDVGLLVLAMNIKWKKFLFIEPRSSIKLAWIAFVCVGSLMFVRGIASGNDTKLVFRDFAIVVYSAFMVVAFYVFDTWEAMRRVGIVVLVGSLVCSWCGLCWFLVHPGQRRLIFYGLYVILSFIGVMVLTFKRLIRNKRALLLLLILGLGVLMSNARSLELALILSLLLFLMTSFGQKVALGKIVAGAARVAMTALVVFAIVWNTAGGKTFIERSVDEFVAGVFHSQEDPNSQFRLLAWAEAGGRFLAQPIIGEGLGVPFIFERSDLDPRPHNTYLTVLYKMGLIGFIPLATLLISIFVKAWKWLKRSKGDPNWVFFQVLILTQFAICVYGGLNLVLESPFLSIAFWVNLGMIWRGLHLVEEHQ